MTRASHLNTENSATENSRTAGNTTTNTENTEQAILTAAEQEFLAKGFSATKTTEIAAKAGVTHAMLHYYFRTKENLFNKIFGAKLRLMGESAMQLFEGDGLPLVERIRQVTERHFDFLAANPEMPRFVLNELIANPQSIHAFDPTLTQTAVALLDKLQKEIDEAVACGTIHPVKPIDLLLNIISLNVFTFIALPIVNNLAFNPYHSSEEFLSTRKRENTTTILNSLVKNRPL